VRGIAIIAPQRLTGTLANVPTAKEQGVEASFTNWRGVVGPKGMRREHAEYWIAALKSASESEAWRRDLERNFWRSNFIPGAQFARFLEGEVATFRAIWDDLKSQR
jgi:putative tricarboxylic transport membrane protein